MQVLIYFALVGGLGFLTDATTLWLLIHFTALHPVAARPLSFLVASIVTWYGNRRFTFAVKKTDKKLQEWLRYLVVNSFGAIFNLGIYTILVLHGSGWIARPLLALTIASILAMFLNFFASKYLAFRLL